MQMKKFLTSFLLLAFVISFEVPAIAKSVESDGENFQEFIKTTKEIRTSYEWPAQEQKMNVNNNSNSKVCIPAHTPIILKNTTTINSSEIKSGDTVKLSVSNDIKSKDGIVLIKSGTPVSASVVFAKDKSRIGQSGEIRISDFHTTAIDGTYVPLSAVLSDTPNNKMAKSIVLSVVICPLFLLIKGNEAQIPAGKTQTAYTHTDIYVDLSQGAQIEQNKQETVPLKKNKYSLPSLYVVE